MVEAERVLAEWSPEKFRIHNVLYGLWWRWDASGYTSEISEAGLYPADFVVPRDTDKMKPVDPNTYPFDAVMAALRLAEARGYAACKADAVAHLHECARNLEYNADNLRRAGHFSAEIRDRADYTVTLASELLDDEHVGKAKL